jgi:membrane peptidoglycan carboxypeptidase
MGGIVQLQIAGNHPISEYRPMTQFGRFPQERCNLRENRRNLPASRDRPGTMQKALIISAKLVLALLSVAGTGLLIVEGWLIWHYEYRAGLPDSAKLAAMSPTGPVCSVDEQRIYIPLSEIPPLIRRAAIAYEEPDFYERPSANPFMEVLLAALHNRTPRPANISQSVSRCLMSMAGDCCKGQNLDRHISQIVLMSRVSGVLSRDRILEIYLNENYFGRSSYGVGAASISYFGKPLGLLSVDEVALIVALPRTPTLLGRRNDIARDRRNYVIDRMQQANIIGDDEASTARERPLQFREIMPDSATHPRKL